MATTTKRDTVRRKPGRPKKDRRADLINQLGEARVKSLDGECGGRCDQLSEDDFEALYNHVSAEKGWGGKFRPAF